MEQGDDDTCAGCADGVTQSDCAAVDVDLAHVKAQLAGNSDGLCCESLVSLDEVEIFNGKLEIKAASASKFYILIQNYADLTIEDVILDGCYEEILPERDDLFCYARDDGSSRLTVVVNFSGETVSFPEEILEQAGQPELCNYGDWPISGSLRPWEARMYIRRAE